MGIFYLTSVAQDSQYLWLKTMLTMCNLWPCWTCQMQDKKHAQTEASRVNKGSN